MIDLTQSNHRAFWRGVDHAVDAAVLQYLDLRISVKAEQPVAALWPIVDVGMALLPLIPLKTTTQVAINLVVVLGKLAEKPIVDWLNEPSPRRDDPNAWSESLKWSTAISQCVNPMTAASLRRCLDQSNHRREEYAIESTVIASRPVTAVRELWSAIIDARIDAIETACARLEHFARTTTDAGARDRAYTKLRQQYFDFSTEFSSIQYVQLRNYVESLIWAASYPVTGFVPGSSNAYSGSREWSEMMKGADAAQNLNDYNMRQRGDARQLPTEYISELTKHLLADPDYERTWDAVYHGDAARRLRVELYLLRRRMLNEQDRWVSAVAQGLAIVNPKILEEPL